MLKKIDDFGDKYLLLKRKSSRDAILFRLSHLADHSILWFALALIRFGIIQNFKDLVRFTLVMLAESALTNGPIKWIFRRTRPHEKENTYDKAKKLPYGLRMPITSSFPSGHAVSAMCAACLLCSSYNFLAIIIFPLGLLVAYTRLYTRMHHLSDIIAGLALGLLFGYLVCRFIII